MKKRVLTPGLIVAILISIVFTVRAKEKTYLFDVKITGSGVESIIFIPGFSCSGDVWDETVAQYKDNYTCYVLTMAGFAGTAPQPDPTFTGWENSIAEYIRDNNIDKPIIIGHSMGGGLAMALAADYPDIIGKIVVVDALPCLAAIMDPSFKSKENNDCSEMINSITSASDEEFYKMQKKNIPMLLADTSRSELVIGWSVKSDRTTFAEMYCDFSNTDLREKIAGIKCPALILLEASFANFKKGIEEQYKNLKTADLQYADKGLHFIMFDDKEWYENQLKKFIGQ
ncbi:MAG TPA: alpha/beta hydrolase [Ignavibacteria bacterium]|nr:alpha/beta hydrolase [Ignavibacteria bacterium]HMR39330.1 alpha/beta hydrolase [Ignavibacteria bacterium]